MAYVIIPILLWILYLFMSDKKEETQKVWNQGGFEIKYRILLNHFYSIPNIKIERKTNTSVILVVKENNVVTRFSIGHGFESITVMWSHHSTRFGKHSLNWKFPESLPQDQMIRSIENDLGNFEQKLFASTYNQ